MGSSNKHRDNLVMQEDLVDRLDEHFHIDKPKPYKGSKKLNSKLKTLASQRGNSVVDDSMM